MSENPDFLTEGSMKIYVWRDVLEDYTSGMVVVLAHDVDEARAMILAEVGSHHRGEFDASPLIYDTNGEPFVEFVYGGG